MATASEAAQDMVRVRTALEYARVHVAGLDQADAARQAAPAVTHSPLRTLLEQAEKAAERVLTYLDEHPQNPGPAASRDGGPI